MAQWQRVYPKFWPDMRGASADAKLIGLYLLTCRHRNTEGYYHLPLGYVTEDIEMSPKRVRDAFAELAGRDFIAYDEQAQIVFIRKALSIPGQAPVSSKQVTGALNGMAHLTPSPLWDEFRRAARTHAPRLADAIDNPIRNPSETHCEGVTA